MCSGLLPHELGAALCDACQTLTQSNEGGSIAEASKATYLYTVTAILPTQLRPGSAVVRHFVSCTLSACIIHYEQALLSCNGLFQSIIKHLPTHATEVGIGQLSLFQI